MTTFHPPENAGRADDLKQRYLEASAAQSIGPSERVRRAALAHAQMVTATAAPALATQAAQAKPGNAAAANRWNFSLVASVAIACIGALLALQFDRSESQDKDVVLGTPSVTAPPVTVQPPEAQSQDLPQKTPASAPTTASATSPSGPPARSVQSAPSAKESALSANSPTAKMQSTQPKAAPESKGPTAQALALPAPVTAAPAAPLKKTETDSTADRASADRLMQSTPPGAQSKASSSADAEFTAQPGAPAASVKSRTAPAAELAAPSAPLMGTGDALRSAARSGQIGLLELALQQGGAAQINAPDKSGRTALMLATLGGHIGAVQRLLTAGADPSLKDAQGNNAVQIAQQLGHTVIENLLKKQPVAQ
jgi:hypothetical protein